MKRKYPEVPIILSTAVSAETDMSFGITTEDERKWIKADLYLEKGVLPERLQKEIAQLLKK
jgi:CheY-like chemotaxis protein